MSDFYTDIETIRNKLCSTRHGNLEFELDYVRAHGAANSYVLYDREGIVVADLPAIGITHQEAIDVINDAIRIKAL